MLDGTTYENNVESYDVFGPSPPNSSWLPKDDRLPPGEEPQVAPYLLLCC
jgi:hypothetical protein